MRLWAMAGVLIAGLGVLGARPAGPLRGFLPAEARREAEFEARFRHLPTPDQAREDLRVLTQEPHVAGTAGDYRSAQFVLNQFRAAGLDAETVEYDVLLAYPRRVKVDLVQPIRRRGPTAENSAHRRGTEDFNGLLPYNAYSPSGDVTAEVVYANYGMPEDYDRLKSAGIDVAGKMVLVRYGRCFRGVKARVAEERGAAGLLIYSDPADDGYRLGAVFPRGPWRPPTAVESGSILSLSDYSGDPLTPGVAAIQSARRLPMGKAHLPRVPTAPLSYEDAEPILEHLEGPAAPPDWQGALPLNYRFGPGPSKVHLKLTMDFRVRPIWDVVARIPGAEHPEEWVVVGNHRDAWSYGAADPASGTAPLLAVARGFGQLLRQGWRPKRTIVVASWDAEEFGLIGSTEWAEEHAAELAQHGVAYLNVDIGVCGPHFNAAAVPSLSRLLREVATEVTDPNSGRPLVAVWAEETGAPKKVAVAGADASPRASVSGSTSLTALPSTTLRDSERSRAVNDESKGRRLEPPDASVRELGSGSDYTPFLEHFGVASANFGFEGPYGVYHSEFDNFDWMANFGDPTFRYSVVAAQILGTLTMRLADADLLPLDYEEYGKAIQGYLREIQAGLRRLHAEEKLPTEDALRAAEQFTETAARVNRAVERAEEGGGDWRDNQRLNLALIELERDFLAPNGLPGRSWFRHVFYAPGVYTGYAAVLVPGVREAMGRGDWPLAGRQLDQVVRAIHHANDDLRRGLEESEGVSSAR